MIYFTEYLSSSQGEYVGDASSTMRRNQRILLDKVKHFWIGGVLEKTATDTNLLEVVKSSANHLVERPWETVIGEIPDLDAISTLNNGTTYRNAIETVEAMSWSWQEARRGLVPGLVIGMIFTLITAYDDPRVFLFSWALWTSPWTIAFCLSGGLKGRKVEKTTRPNQGIWLSGRNGIFLGGLVGLTLTIFFWLFREVYSMETRFAILMGLMTFFSLAMTNGADIIGHFLIRLLLFFTNRIPLNLTDFLDHAAGLILLRKVVGGVYFYSQDVDAIFFGDAK